MSDQPIQPTSVLTSDRRQFRMKSCLGRGGFGEVYRATMSSAGGLQTEVAVKVLHAEVDPGSQAVQRLRDEGRMLGAVRHPSVLKVHDLVVLDGRVALVTEYVEGQDLDKCIPGPPGGPRRADALPPRAMVEVIARVADALHAAYNAPVPGEVEVEGRRSGRLELIHRDIKPANIRLGRHGEVKLLDFGIARAATPDREARTDTNAMLGSYLYMAPERFLENTDSGAPVDVYGLGLTLYEGLTGLRLYGEMSLKDIYLLILDPVKYEAHVRRALETIPSEVPHQVVALIQRTLSLDPAGRPDHQTLAKTCHELVDRLPGKTLDRWARTREWPPPRTVRGVLDGAVITETAFLGTGQLHRPAHSRSGARGFPTGEDSQGGDLLRTASATLERPGVVVGVGVGLFGLTSLLAVLLGLATIGVVALVSALSAGGEDPLPPIAPAPPIEAPPPTAPVDLPGVDLPAGDLPGAEDPAADPAPPQPAPAAPAAPRPRPPAPAEEPQVRPEPAPAPVPTPRPPPASSSSEAVVEVQGGVLVEFRGKSGTFRAGKLPAGTYEIRAHFSSGWVSQDEALYVTPGQRVVVKCSDLKMKCWVQK